MVLLLLNVSSRSSSRASISRGSASHESVVLGMRADPEPHYSVISVHPKSPVVEPNPDGMKAAHSLEMKRRMFGIAFQQIELTIRDLADSHR